MKKQVENKVSTIRTSRGVSASDLAARVGVSRQTIYAIEAGTYVPNTAVALHIARELEVTVNELFTLQESDPTSLNARRAEVLSDNAAPAGQPVRVCRVGLRWVCVPVTASPYYLPEADAVVKRAAKRGAPATLQGFGKDGSSDKRLVLAGCDPATSLFAGMVEATTGIEVVCAAASSRLALKWLSEGKVHVAGSHLEDPGTGEFNLPFLCAQYPKEDFAVITFARWEEGFVVAPDNPKRVRSVEDLTRRNVRFVNREIGSGSRGLLDARLKSAGIEGTKIRGYDRVAHGHLAAAHAVLTGEADACVATQSAASAFGLDFVALHAERYDLVMRRRTLDTPSIQRFLDVLQRAALRRKLEMLAGYDTSETGNVVT